MSSPASELSDALRARPRIVRTRSWIQDLAITEPSASHEPAVLVLGAARLERRTLEGELLGEAAIEGQPFSLVPLLGGRVLVRDRRGGGCLVHGEACETIALASRGAGDAIALAHGFAISSHDTVLVEHEGRRATRSLGLHRVGLLETPTGILAWSRFGWALLDLDAGELARGDEALTSRPVVIGNDVIGVGDGALVHLRADRGEARVHRGWRVERAPAVFDGFVALATDHGVTLIGPVDGALRERERIALPWTPYELLARDRRVIARAPLGTAACAVIDGAWDATVLSLEGELRGVETIGRGLALVDDRADVRVIDRDPSIVHAPELGVLHHDFAPQRVRGTPRGLASAEGEVLRLFELGIDHAPPAYEPAIADPPRGALVVVDDALIGSRVSEGLFAYAFRTKTQTRRVVRGTPHRPLVSREAAQRELDDWIERAATIAPLARPAAVPSLGTRHHLEELALALETSARVLVASFLAARAPLRGPLSVEGYEYLGSFETTGALVVCDPCHRERRDLAPRIDDAMPGTWHVLVRPGTGEAADREAELVAVHALGLPLAADEELRGLVGVDAGIVGIYDAACAMPSLDGGEILVGPFRGKGAHCHSGHGDGGYVARVARAGGKVVKVRVPFLDGERDDSVVASSVEIAAKPYSARTRFAVGDVVEHVKFGRGSVVGVSTDTVEIAFAGERRTLVHGRG
ncbi:MAG: hypothetical protein U0353_34310 [Sandaracinus sp.]